jgi:hypothetical protein
MITNLGLEKCILCLENSIDSLEHIIPESLGGRLQLPILCRKCNSELGSRLISKLKKDPSIRLAAKALSNEIQELTDSIEEGQVYIGKDIKDNLVKHTLKDSKFRIIETKKEDNSLVLKPENVKKYIRKKLEKVGAPEREIIDKINSYEKLGNNEIIRLNKNESIGKWEIKTFEPSLEGTLLDEKVMVLIAYEYLALLLDKEIFTDKFNFIRDYILINATSSKLSVNRFGTRKYLPYHKIYPEFFSRYTIINITLFGWLLFKVRIGIPVENVIDLVYLEDLKRKRTLFSESVNNAKNGIYKDLENY